MEPRSRNPLTSRCGRAAATKRTKDRVDRARHASRHSTPRRSAALNGMERANRLLLARVTLTRREGVRRWNRLNGAAPESNRPSVGLPRRTDSGLRNSQSESTATPRTIEGYEPTTRSYSTIIRASSGGVSQLAPIHSRSSSVTSRATAQPFQTKTGTWLSTSFVSSSRKGGTPTPSTRSAASREASSVASPASTTAHSCPASIEPFAAMWRGIDARVGSADPAVER